MTSPNASRLAVVGLGIALATLLTSTAGAYDVYLANENHTDYGWNASVADYEGSMLSELDYYLARIAATATAPPTEQTRFVADSWYYLWLYQQHRSGVQFETLLDAIRSGHIAVPLNPLVLLFGALPTEAAIRAGYYPGRITRAYGIDFLHAEYMENQTMPWGLASLWAGSGVKYSWRGICGCASGAPFRDHMTDAFRWRGPDDKELLMKWYQFDDNNTSWGGYAEARFGIDDDPLGTIQATIDRFSARGQPVAGLFGYGWDDVNSETESVGDAARQWNAAHPGGDRAIVSNVIDYFEALEAHRDQLPVLRGGWGNDWDLWPTSMSAATARTRRAIERLRTIEALATLIHPTDATYWTELQPALENGLLDYFRFFEHAWGPSTKTLKLEWADAVDDVVDQAETGASLRLRGLFTTPNEDRFVVVNPLVFERTDYADVPAPSSGPFTVTDVTTGAEVPSQLVTTDSGTYLRILARDVPSFGYRVYRYTLAASETFPDAAIVTDQRIENDRYRVDIGGRGQITSLFAKAIGSEIAGEALNDFGSGASGSASAENVGAVSATLRVDIPGQPARRTRVTLVRDVARVEIDDEILTNYTHEGAYRFDFNLSAPAIRFEEVGAIAAPGRVGQGGNFLPGTRGDFMTLNHFVSLAGPLFNVALSNWDAYAMRVGNSADRPFDFDLPTSHVSVLATGNPAQNEIADQGGAQYFRNRFALAPSSGPASMADSMRVSLGHQNPLRAILLGRNQIGPFTASSATFLAITAPNVVVTAVKPAEESARGLIVRAWELDGLPTDFTIDATAFAPNAAFQTTLIETDLRPAVLSGGRIEARIAANEIQAYRVVLSAPVATPTPSATPTTSSPRATASRTVTVPVTPTASATTRPSSSPTPVPSPTEAPSATPTDTPAATSTRTLTPSPAPADTLARAIGPRDTIIPIAGADAFPDYGGVRIDTELIAYRGRQGDGLRVVERGAGTTEPAAHAAGALVIYVPPCRGDCDADFIVRVNELVVAVDMVLGRRRLDQCAAADGDHDGAVGIDELVMAVANSIDGCR